MQAKDYIPLTETSFFILLSLAVTPRHGYGIIKEVENMSGGRVVLAAGTLYTALRRMLEDNWIERVEVGTSGKSMEGHERKLYRLTDLGRSILDLETERLKNLVSLTNIRKAAG